MFNPVHFYEAGKARSGTALFPVTNSITNTYITISTRLGNGVIKWGDGVENLVNIEKFKDFTVINHPLGNFYHNYSSIYSGNISVVFNKGLQDVYSVRLYRDVNNYYYYNIQNLTSFLSQFTNLYSFVIQLSKTADNTIANIVKGDLSLIPNSIEKIAIENTSGIVNNGSDFFLNIQNFNNNSQLKYFFSNIDGRVKVNGNLNNLPPLITYFKIISVLAYSAITYTAGKVWASSFDTLSIPLSLTTAELDALLADMDGSILTKTGAGVISVIGYRSSASDAFVASLQSKGFTVNVTRNLNINSYSDSALLRLDFQNNFDVYSNSGMNISAGGTSNQPTFALSGRKAGEYCAVFNGSQSIKTNTNLPINSDKVTIKFWMKTAYTSTGAVMELSPVWSTPGTNSFALFTNADTINKLLVGEQTTNTVRNIRETALSINDNIWKRFSVVIDRTNPTATKISIYINGVLASRTASTNGSTTGNFVNNILFVGQRAGSSLGFNGSLMHLEILNYPITTSEALADYNSFL